MTSLLNAVTEGIGEKISIGEGAVYALIGFLVVFFGIAFLILILTIFGLIMKKVNAPKKKSAKESVSVSVPQQTQVSVDEVSDEVKVAIVAAIMAFYQNEKPKCEFTVKRIKKI